MELVGLAFLFVGIAIVVSVGYVRVVVGDTRPGAECVKCGEEAVWDDICAACGAFQ